MDNKIFIDLDKSDKLPQITAFQGQVYIKKNGRIIVRNSIFEDIDTLTEQDLEYILVNFKQYISPILTSMYIPKASIMEVIKKVAPEFKVRFKTFLDNTDSILKYYEDKEKLIKIDVNKDVQDIFKSILEVIND